MTDRAPIDYLTHWYHSFVGLKITPQAFYEELEQRISAHSFPSVTLGRIEIRESGAMSAKRTYLRVLRGDLAFDICGAPFGRSIFFSSYWLGRIGMSGCGAMALGCLAMFPGIGLLAERALKPLSCYEVDTALIFQESIHAIVIGYLDELCGISELAPLTANERAASMKRLISPEK